MKQCAPKISKHFTELTSVINEGNSYEFPSPELHKAILNKLIFNDERYFSAFIRFIKDQFRVYRQEIADKFPKYLEQFENFVKNVERDINGKNGIDIDSYLKDLKRHSMQEYNDLYNKECQNLTCLEGKSRKKKRKARNKNAQNPAAPQQQIETASGPPAP
jgi:hypothetical protein